MSAVPLARLIPGHRYLITWQCEDPGERPERGRSVWTFRRHAAWGRLEFTGADARVLMLSPGEVLQATDP